MLNQKLFVMLCLVVALKGNYYNYNDMSTVEDLFLAQDLQVKHCTSGQNCYCDCGWANSGTCGHDDGSCCHSCCCGGGSGPSPSPWNPSPGPAPSGLKDCPLTLDGGQSNSHVSGNSFHSTSGYGRAKSQQKYNMLGGGMTFTMDLSRCKDKVNCNLYLVIPGTLGNNGYYCDNGGSAPTCIELDIFESNGHSLVAQTMHTKLGKGVGGCDTYGCRQLTNLNGNINGNRPIDCTVDISHSGEIKITYSQNGHSTVGFSNLASKDGGAPRAVVEGMRNHGAVVVTGLWTGWVPPNSSGTGDLNGSGLTVTNLKVSGRSMGRV